ncbi:hypothetical protein LBMAG53_01870 [Planctomycetota bacterium]|nr:hypothetical protein LBMAG53_01870 [Planctomycetota bacterium]
MIDAGGNLRGSPRPQSPASRPLLAGLALVAGLVAGFAVAADPAPAPTQPVLLSLPELQKLLDPTKEWQFLPLADYRALVAAGKPSETPAAQPWADRSAWIESADVTGRIETDNLLLITARLVVVAPGTATGARLCLLSEAAPEQASTLTLAGSPGLLTADRRGMLVPGPGRHAVVLTAAYPSTGSQTKAEFSIPLPLAAGVAATFTATTPGILSGEGIALAPTAPRPAQGAGPADGAAPAIAWRLVRQASNLRLTWQPGASRTGHVPAWGAEQTATITLGAERDVPQVAWSAAIALHRGERPAAIDLDLPPGWVATAPGPGIAAIEPLAANRVRLRLTPEVERLSFTGEVRRSDGSLTLPTIVGALHQGGTLTIAAGAPFAAEAPATWREVAGSGAGVRSWRLADSRGAVVVTSGLAMPGGSQTSATLTVGERRWRLDQRLVIAAGSLPRFSASVQLPLGWAVAAFYADRPVRIPGVSDGGGIEAIVPGSVLDLTLVRGIPAGGHLALTLALERPADPAAPGDPIPVKLAHVVGSDGKHAARLAVAAAPGLDLDIAAGDRWRLVEAAERTTTNDPSLGIRAEFVATDPAAALRIAARPRPASADADAVVYLLPAPPGGTAAEGAGAAAGWLRIDLRLRAQAGEVSSLFLTAPLIARDPGGSPPRAGQPPALTSVDPTLVVERSGDGWRLAWPAPWRGERLIRLEGRMSDPGWSASGQARLELTAVAARLDAGDSVLPLRQTTVVQTPGDLDLTVEPAPGAAQLGEDDVPGWSQPIPGEGIAGVVRSPAGVANVGVAKLVARPLATAPGAFIAQLDLRTQLGEIRGGCFARHRIHLRLAAPKSTSLPILLPSGLTLERAAVDGRDASLRRIDPATGACALPLPGRTVSEVTLILRADLPLGRQLHLMVPAFPGVPVVATTWTVAVPEHLRPVVVDQPGTMPLLVEAPWRGWWDTWRTPWSSVVLPSFPMLPAVAGTQDPRVLVPAENRAVDLRQGRPADAVDPTPGPDLSLVGTLLTGQRTGAPVAALIGLTSIHELFNWDCFGEIAALGLGLGLGLLLVLRRSWLIVGATLVGGLLAAAACHGAEHHGWGLMALGEWLPLTTAVSALALLLARWLGMGRRRPVSMALWLLAVGSTATGLVSTHGLMAGETAPNQPPPGIELVAMGYRSLDPGGVPKDVQVALTRDQLTRLWTLAHPEPTQPTPPIVDFATGLPSWEVVFPAGADPASHPQATVTIRLPWAVLSNAWQPVRFDLPFAAQNGQLPTVATQVLTVESTGPGAGPGKGGTAPLTWSREGNTLIVPLPPRSQGTLTLRFQVFCPVVANQMLIRLASRAPLNGGKLTVIAPVGWVVDGASEFRPDGDHRWTGSVGVHEAGADIAVIPEVPVTAKALRLAWDQRLRVELLPDRLAWTDAATITATGAGVRQLDLDLPPDLTIATVSSASGNLAEWRQTGTRLHLLFNEEATGAIALTLTGLLPRTDRPLAVAPTLASAATSAGRLGLRSQLAAAKLIRPEGAERAEPAADEDLAVVWNGGNGPMVSWKIQADAVLATVVAALVPGPDRIQAVIVIESSGKGEIASLRLPMAPPWRLARLGEGLTAAVVDGAIDLLPKAPLGAGGRMAVVFEADRAALGRSGAGDLSFSLPQIAPAAVGLTVVKRTWLVAAPADRRLRLDAPGAVLVPPAGPAAVIARGQLLGDEPRWQQAAELPPDLPTATVSLLTEPARAQVTASHYLLALPDRVRWSARLAWRIDGGARDRLALRLDPALRLVHLSCRDLGGWTRTGDRLELRLAAPARGDIAVDLDLEAALDADRVRLSAMVPEDATMERGQVALALDDDLGLVQRDTAGLEPVAKLDLPLPVGIDAAQIQDKWKTSRADWTLTLSRELLAAGAGLDGVAPLLAASTVLTSEGECRSKATWHVINRSRQQLRLVVPTGIDLWEVRVDGQPIRPRTSGAADPGKILPDAQMNDRSAELWVPVRPLRPGEATTRVELVWRQAAPALGSSIRPKAPVFADLRLMDVTWRVVPPAGLDLRRIAGALHLAEPVAAQGLGAQRVIDEIRQLKAQGNLTDNGLRRLSSNLARCEVELNDYLVQLGNQPANRHAEPAQQRSAPDQPAPNQAPNQQMEVYNAQLVQDLNRNSLDANQGQAGIAQEFSKRSSNRKSRGYENPNQIWNDAPVAQGKAVPASQPAALPEAIPPTIRPWSDPLLLDSGAKLGPGDAPVGRRSESAIGRLGIDLVQEPVSAGLWLAGSGTDLGIELALDRPRPPWWPWLAAAGAAGCVLGAGLLAWRKTVHANCQGAKAPTVG